MNADPELIEAISSVLYDYLRSYSDKLYAIRLLKEFFKDSGVEDNTVDSIILAKLRFIIESQGMPVS